MPSETPTLNRKKIPTQKSLGEQADCFTKDGRYVCGGTVVGYKNSPMVCLEDPFGNQTWARADMCQVRDDADAA
ncbi:hypothetical protein [Terriglobus saanensis]|uniref:Uncharacterized protein n=1 Tax=Terriglobus saanensis (strain ATCC BAA-1853 / DSM 23119 / SP1PR4) TaxID=401053 RepID=E8V6Q1_TERSS|nr:hypothetical protein [Terriglobus saanensis]ADV83853.1 hypothetical protein AciPR4_3095 [Terriglobus saanensis SP1PR4]